MEYMNLLPTPHRAQIQQRPGPLQKGAFLGIEPKKLDENPWHPFNPDFI